MAKVVGRSRIRDTNGTGVRLSEYAVFISIAILILLAARWYFVVYRHSPGVAAASFFGSVQSGSGQAQYDMLDDMDKEYWPTLQSYEKALGLDHAYTERLDHVSTGPSTPDTKDPNVVSVPVTLTVHSNYQGRELYQAGSDKTAQVNLVMRKDKDGAWKVWLHKSNIASLMAITPNPAGSNF